MLLVVDEKKVDYVINHYVDLKMYIFYRNIVNKVLTETNYFRRYGNTQRLVAAAEGGDVVLVTILEVRAKAGLNYLMKVPECFHKWQSEHNRLATPVLQNVSL